MEKKIRVLVVDDQRVLAEEIAGILEAGSRENAGELAPAKGLTLMEVRY